LRSRSEHLSSRHCLLRLGAVRGGAAFDEDFYIALAYQSFSGIVQWGARQLYSLRAPSGELDRATPLLHAIISSVEATLLWSTNYQIVFDLFTQRQYEAIRSAGELSRYLAKNADEIASTYRAAYESQKPHMTASSRGSRSTCAA
jgi:hypothetical protein